MSLLNQQQIDKITKHMKNKFWFFCQALMPAEWWDDEFHMKLCEFLQFGGPRKLVILPRTHLKTTICATYYPLWRASVDVNKRILNVSNTAPNAQKTLRSIRSQVENNKVYQAFFLSCVPDFNKVRWSDICATLRRPEDYPEGTFESAGVNTNIIRRHYNMVIEDDTVAPRKDDLTGEECMPGKEDIEQAIGFHRLTPPLLINEDDEQLVIGTRWRGDDHINYIMKNEKFAIFDKPADRKVTGEPGTLYKRFSIDRLDNIRASMGSYMYSALYLNKPLSKEFMCFNPDWMRYYEESELPEEGQSIVTVDPADPPTGKKSQDYSAIVSCKHTKKGIFVRRYVRDRLTDKQVIDKAIDLAIQDGAIKIRVEIDRYAHLQFGFRETMKQREVYFVLDAVKTKGKNKEGRIRQRLQPMFENRIIFTKKGMRELEDELFTFPNGSHDDLIDALAWQIEGVYPTEREIETIKPRRTLPTFGEMLDTLYKRGRIRNYPFDRQLGIPNMQ